MRYVIRRTPPDELVHYGISGQKWGVRRWQNEDGSYTPEGRLHYGYGVNVKELDKELKSGVRNSQLRDAHVIPKGTKIYRTTSTAQDGTKGTTYVSYMDVDRQHYKGGWIRQTGSTGEAYEHEYILNEDLKVPSRDMTKQVISEVMRQNEKEIRETVDAWLDTAMPEGTWARADAIYNEADRIAGLDGTTEKTLQQAWKNITNEHVKEYKDMSVDEAVFYTMQTFGLNPKMKNKVVSKLQDLGYNAMTDEASVGGQNGWLKEGGDPLIIFERDGLLTEKSSHKIGSKEERKSQLSYNKQIRKGRSDSYGAWSEEIGTTDSICHFWQIHR